MRRLALVFALALSACDEPAEFRSAPVDQTPSDPFSFGCDLPPVDIADLTPQGCAIMLTACIDAATGPCGDGDAKACQSAVDECVTSTQTACWDRL